MHFVCFFRFFYARPIFDDRVNAPVAGGCKMHTHVPPNRYRYLTRSCLCRPYTPVDPL